MSKFVHWYLYKILDSNRHANGTNTNQKESTRKKNVGYVVILPSNMTP